MFITVCYDIPDDKRRTRVSKTLEGFGYRVQKSVFECDIELPLYEKMQKRITKIVNVEEDSVRYYCLCQTCVSKITISGLGEVKREKPFFVV
jgi:CRISPR-associated protein Cas2